MGFKLIRRREVPFPTFWGLLLLVILLTFSLALWIQKGESFYAVTQRKKAEVLVVESWIGAEGINAALAEFKGGGYQHILVVGTDFQFIWGEGNANYAELAAKILRQGGIPREQILIGHAVSSARNRTLNSAICTRQQLALAGSPVNAINVFTRGAHARRSRLVFSRVVGRNVEVGCIAWFPKSFTRERAWWENSQRAEDLLKESFGYPFELITGLFLRTQ